MTTALIAGIVVAALCCAAIVATVYGAQVTISYSQRCERCGRWVDSKSTCDCE